jgi:parallel beta-helix repeat protein
MISKNYIGGMETPQGLAFCEYGIETKSSSNNTITQNNVTLCQRAIRFEGYSTYGEDASNNSITENSIQHSEWGLWISGSSNNTIMRNNITVVFPGRMFETTGIILYDHSFFNIIAQNKITSHNEGVKLEDSHVNTLTQNDVKYNIDGIVLSSSTLNVLTYNNIESNSQSGIRVKYAYENYVNPIYHNNFIDNGIQVLTDSFPNNTWDDDYGSGGNYWSNYTGVDSCCGPYQNETGSDGIGDTQYTIDADNVDRYPLVAPISTFDAGIWNSTTYSVDFVSNSTVSCIDFTLTDPSQATLAFNVTGETGTQGFCRVCIPKALINGSFVLWLDGTIISEPQYQILPASDESYTYIYITYTHSQHTVTITGTTTIPEFPSLLILPLLMILAVLAVNARRKATRREIL